MKAKTHKTIPYADRIANALIHLNRMIAMSWEFPDAIVIACGHHAVKHDDLLDLYDVQFSKGN